MEDEEWRPVPGFESHYQISNHGRLRNKRGKILKWQIGKGGYNFYLAKAGQRSNPKTVKAHILVAQAFLGHRPEGLCVLHNDGNPQNNHLTNLRYGSFKENSHDMIVHGRSLKGEKNHNSKLTQDNVKEIREKRKHHTLHELAKMYGVSHVAVWYACKGVTW